MRKSYFNPQKQRQFKFEQSVIFSRWIYSERSFFSTMSWFLATWNHLINFNTHQSNRKKSFMGKEMNNVSKEAPTIAEQWWIVFWPKEKVFLSFLTRRIVGGEQKNLWHHNGLCRGIQLSTDPDRQLLPISSAKRL